MPVSLTLAELRIEGSSRAGDETWFRVHPPGLALDAGRGAPQLAGATDLFLTHGHLDHALGVPFVLSLRSLQSAEETRIHCPVSLADDLSRLIRAAEATEGARYLYRVNGLRPGDRVEAGHDLEVEAFATHHSVPSLGYHLWRTRRRLSPAYRERSPTQLANLRRQGIAIETLEQSLWLSYCGDTSAAVFELDPRIFQSAVLLLECTFWRPESRSRASRFKHIHWEEILAQAGRFRNRELVLHHPSRRYKRRDIGSVIEAHRDRFGPRIHLFGDRKPADPRSASASSEPADS